MLSSLNAKVSRYIKNENGATAIEYGLIAGLVSIAALTAMTALGPKLLAAFEKVSTGLN